MAVFNAGNLDLEINVGPAERAVSAFAGGILVGAGLGQRSWGGALLAIAGATVAMRGLIGHCALNAAMGRNSTSARDGGYSQSQTHTRSPIQGRGSGWRQSDDELVDSASQDSFPASDPPSYSSHQAGAPDHRRSH